MNKFMLFAMLILGFATIASADDPVVGPGKHVKMDYTLFVNNEQVETSVGKEPLEFNIGDNTIIPGLESQLTGMHVNEEKTVTVAAKDAYGEIDPKAFKDFPKSSLPKNVEPKVGMVLQATAPDGENFPAVISELKDDKVKLDFNHPLAGKDLKFNVKVLSITDAPPAALKSSAADEDAADKTSPAMANTATTNSVK